VILSGCIVFCLSSVKRRYILIIKVFTFYFCLILFYIVTLSVALIICNPFIGVIFTIHSLYLDPILCNVGLSFHCLWVSMDVYICVQPESENIHIPCSASQRYQWLLLWMHACQIVATHRSQAQNNFSVSMKSCILPWNMASKHKCGDVTTRGERGLEK
jgi:hypothetical protein